MASDLSNLARTFTGSFLEFYDQHDGTIRVRVYTSANSATLECIITAAHFVTIVNAMLASGTSLSLAGAAGNVVRTSEALGPMGADLTVNAA